MKHLTLFTALFICCQLSAQYSVQQDWLLEAGLIGADCKCTYDEDEILGLMENYVNTMSNYIQSPTPKEAQYLKPTLNLFTDKECTHFYDLPGDEDVSWGRFSIWQYLFKVRTKENQTIDFEYFEDEDAEINECVQTIDGIPYQLVGLTRRYEKGKEKGKVYVVVVVDVSKKPYLINGVGPPTYYKEKDDCKDDQITTSSEAKKVKEEVSVVLVGRRQRAEDAYKKEDYLRAKELYEEILELSPNDRQAMERIAECRNKLTARSFVVQGDNYIDQKAYEKAIRAYRQSLEIEESLDTRGKIRQCERIMAEFDRSLKEGEAYFENGQYRSAKSAYQTALDIRPGDVTVQRQISACNTYLAREASFDSDFKEAMYLADKNKHDQAFALLEKHAYRKKYNANTYFYMGQVLYNNSKGVIRNMNYTNRQAKRYSLDYLELAIKKGDRDAKKFLNTVCSNRFRKQLRRKR